MVNMNNKFKEKFNKLCKAQSQQDRINAWRELFQTEGIELSSDDVEFLKNEADDTFKH